MTQDLDPGIRLYLERVAALAAGKPAPANVEEQRAAYVTVGKAFAQPHPPGVSTSDQSIAANGISIPIRVYRTGSQIEMPGIVYFHGGGWVLGDIETHDSIAAELCAMTGSVVVSVHYRRAPENPYPAAFDDAYAVLCHVAGKASGFGIDASRLALAGDSAGGNLAAAVALAARDRKGPRLRAQALIYPVLGNDLDLPSYRQNAAGPTLTRTSMATYWGHYVPGGPSKADCYAAPLLAARLQGLPPAIILTAEYDPVRDDGREYAERLREAGVEVVYRNAPRLPHGWLRARAMSAAARTEFDVAGKWLADKLGRG